MINSTKYFARRIVEKRRILFFSKGVSDFLYPPKGAAKVKPEWGSIVFTYVLIVPSCCLGTYFDVSKKPTISAF